MSTFTQIGTAVSVGSGGAASIDFSSIPSTYTDLVVFFSARGVATSDFPATGLKFNGSATSYSSRFLLGSGSAASSGVGGTSTYIRLGNADGSIQTGSTFASTFIYIPNYAGSTNKSVSIDMVSESNTTAAYSNLSAGLWSNTATISSISLFIDGANLAQYSSAYLYGVSNA
jgi:hypothetical protein